MTTAVIEGKKIYIEEQPTDTDEIIYTKISNASLIFVMYVSAVLRIDKRKHYILSKQYPYSKRSDWILSIYLLTVTKSIWGLLEITFLKNQKLELCVIRIPKP